MTKFKRGDQIAYVPDHAADSIDHPDTEFGFIVRPGPTGTYYCRYWRMEGGKPVMELRTKANSECTPARNLVRFKNFSQKVVETTLENIEAEQRRIFGR